jgi:hypothetical protein
MVENNTNCYVPKYTILTYWVTKIFNYFRKGAIFAHMIHKTHQLLPIFCNTPTFVSKCKLVWFFIFLAWYFHNILSLVFAIPTQRSPKPTHGIWKQQYLHRIYKKCQLEIHNICFWITKHSLSLCNTCMWLLNLNPLHYLLMGNWNI